MGLINATVRMTSRGITMVEGMDLRSLGIQASKGLDPAKLQLLTCECTYYHYMCDGEDDRGWGCGYRSLQSLCSWVQNRKKTAATSTQVPPPSTAEQNPVPSPPTAPGSSSVPSLHRIQEALVNMGDKPQTFLSSKEWIGSFEVCIVLDHLYGVACKIIHVSNGGDVQHLPTLVEHFGTIGSPVMIGGDIDAASKTLVGLLIDPSMTENTKFLIADPHYCGGADETSVIRDGYVKWHGLELFQTSSFYNFCLPQAF